MAPDLSKYGPPNGDSTEAHAIIKRLNEDFALYATRFSEQFHLKIPKGTIRTINEYRDHYFPYLKDSQYKSNLCYLLQLIDYQLWNYKLFRPGLSLENAYFYQLLITMGIVAEGAAAAILLDPFLSSNEKDRSLGGISSDYAHAGKKLIEQSFHENLKLIQNLSLLPEDVISTFQKLRIQVRNQVHVQGWEGRIYGNVTLELFQEHLKNFRSLLKDIKQNLRTDLTPDMLLPLLFEDIDTNSGPLKGVIIHYDINKGFGFIENPQFENNLFFHRTQLANPMKRAQETIVGKKVLFRVAQGEKGFSAIEIIEENHDTNN